MRFNFDPPDNAQWVLWGSASIGTENAVSAPNALRLLARRGGGPSTSSQADRIITVTPGVPHTVRLTTNGNQSGGRLTVQIQEDGLVIAAAALDAPLGPGNQVWEALTFTPVGSTVKLTFITPLPGVSGGGLGTVSTWFVDDVDVDGDLEVLMARSTTASFMRKLQALVQSVDPNIGQVFITTKRWASLVNVETDGRIRIAAAGAFDGSSRVGRDVTRFWLMQPSIDTKPLTNGSAEYITRIQLIGFFSFESGDGQETALLQAAIEILDKINTLASELTTLSTGDGYLGYLTERPKMGQIQQGSLEGDGLNVKGHVVNMTVTYSEEVSYS